MAWKKKSKMIAAGGVLLLSVIVLVALRYKPEHHAESRGKFLVTSVLNTDEEITKQYVGQIRAIQHIELRALERGYLTETFVDEGQHIHKGQRMFRIMPLLNRAELKKAEAEAEVTKIEYDNTLNLAQHNIVSANELALAKAKYDKATAARELAQVHLDLTEVKAPFDGIMGRFNVRLGSLVAEGDLLTTLSDNSKMWVYFNVSEAQYLAYKEQVQGSDPLTVKLLMANGKVFDEPGVVQTIEADFNNETGNIAFRATFPNEKGILRHGETGDVLMTVPLKNVLVIPQAASFDVLEKKYVYVVDDKNTLQSREITVAYELPHLFVVKSGLSAGEHILIEGVNKVQQGDKIEVDLLKPSEAIARQDVPAS